jgi:hypothetical protein
MDVMIGKTPRWKVAAVVIKLFWKPISKTKKGFRKPLLIVYKSPNLSAAF